MRSSFITQDRGVGKYEVQFYNPVVIQDRGGKVRGFRGIIQERVGKA
jgi:hypothetical protein